MIGLFYSYVCEAISLEELDEETGLVAVNPTMRQLILGYITPISLVE